MTTKTRPVLLVSDVANGFEKLDLDRFDLEISEQETITGIMGGIERSGYNCIHINDPKALKDSAAEYPNCVVLSIWSGQRNRNRRAIVPSICEAHGISYVGADPYAALISADKELSKSICSSFGIRTPAGILIHSASQSDRAGLLEFPIVVKPLMEGGSIGITQDSKVNNLAEAQAQISELMTHHDPPILCEEFVGGREISFCVVGSGTINHFEAVEVQFDGEQNYFDSKLFSMHDKRSADRQKKHRFVNVTNQMPDTLVEQIRSMYLALGKVDYMRVDGKFTDQFWCLEISTDPSISTMSIFMHSYLTIGKSYCDMISDILSTRLSNEGGGV